MPEHIPEIKVRMSMRIRPVDRDLIDAAAAAEGKSRSNFIIDASYRAAEEILLDRTLFRVSPTAYRQFIEILDAPPPPNESLRRLMHLKAPWD